MGVRYSWITLSTVLLSLVQYDLGTTRDYPTFKSSFSIMNYDSVISYFLINVYQATPSNHPSKLSFNFMWSS